MITNTRKLEEFTNSSNSHFPIYFILQAVFILVFVDLTRAIITGEEVSFFQALLAIYFLIGSFLFPSYFGLMGKSNERRFVINDNSVKYSHNKSRLKRFFENIRPEIPLPENLMIHWNNIEWIESKFMRYQEGETYQSIIKYPSIIFHGKDNQQVMINSVMIDFGRFAANGPKFQKVYREIKNRAIHFNIPFHSEIDDLSKWSSWISFAYFRR